MFRKFDRSPFLIQTLQKISAYFAKNKGVLILWGIMFVIIAFVLEIVSLFTTNLLVEMMVVIFRNVGILMALIGLLIIRPLGSS